MKTRKKISRRHDAVLTAFIRENDGRLVSLAYRLTRNTEDARDLVQDALLRACERFHQFDGRNLGGWLYTIIRNSWIEGCRSRQRQSNAAPMFAARGGSDLTEDRAELCLVLQDVMRLLQELPKPLRQAIMMRSSGSSYRETARRARVPLNTIKVRIFRGRAALAEAL
jgi:RNA polymerase sigma-70 factor (ECF subfamily)